MSQTLLSAEKSAAYISALLSYAVTTETGATVLTMHSTGSVKFGVGYLRGNQLY